MLHYCTLVLYVLSLLKICSESEIYRCFCSVDSVVSGGGGGLQQQINCGRKKQIDEEKNTKKSFK